MALPGLVRVALSMSPRVVAGKALRMAGRMVKNRLIGKAMRRQCTYPLPDPAMRLAHIRTRPLDPALLDPHAEALRVLAARSLRHDFDLLGSGWVRVAKGTRYAGFGGWKYDSGHRAPPDWKAAVLADTWPGNQGRVALLLALIDDPAYTPLDWHADFKSGYRWSPRVWGGSVPYGHKPGVDVKVPWELARVQHLPRLALVHAIHRDPALPRQFRNQVLDFLAANPPGWGVNWACAMDVAIRAANLILAWDLFRAQGVAFDDDFEDELGAALLAHGRHIAHHLEWNPHHRGNHYLADICGLAWIAAALPRSRETDLWLAFAVQQLEAEIPRQFGADGGNFEASTAYHRLSAEMALFTVALIVGLPADKQAALAEYDASAWRLHPPVAPGPMAWPPFGAATVDRLGRALAFAADTTKPSGDMVQVGDNDSGRFVKLMPSLDGDGHERVLDARHLLAAGQGLFDLGLPLALDGAIVAALAGGARFAAPAAPAQRIDGVAEGTAESATRVVIAPADPAALDGLVATAYADFGLFLWRGERAFVSVRCGPIGCNGLGAHAHNDQLAVEIEIDGVAFVRDPGTFVYTPDLAARNRYRSAAAHFVPKGEGEGEPARLDLGPFRLEDRAQARALRFADGEFIGVHTGFGTPVWRRVCLRDGVIVVEDCRGGALVGPHTQVTEHRVSTPAELAGLWGLTLPFSRGYGLQ